MPIANQIAELSSYFIVILGAILLEKMLVAVVGYVSFIYIIPTACFLGISYLYLKNEVLKILAVKLAIFGIILFAAIPASILVSDLIDNSYQATIEQTFETSEQTEKYIEEKKQDLSTEDQNFLKIFRDFIFDSTSKIENTIDVTARIKWAEERLNVFLETIAVLIITTCVIPIVVILIFAWIIKILFSFDSIGISTIFRNKLSKENSHRRDIID